MKTNPVVDKAPMAAKRQQARRRLASATTNPATGATAAPPRPTQSNTLATPSQKTWGDGPETMLKPTQSATGKRNHHKVSPVMIREVAWPVVSVSRTLATA